MDDTWFCWVCNLRVNIPLVGIIDLVDSFPLFSRDVSPSSLLSCMSRPQSRCDAFIYPSSFLLALTNYSDVQHGTIVDRSTCSLYVLG